MALNKIFKYFSFNFIFIYYFKRTCVVPYALYEEKNDEPPDKV